ncbi:MAG TPA: hypothetical protein PKZ32_06005 [Candidatus Melainabacteria bacterium]|nr:hypothetical protein [Candidatus Melainabacteria bacterium]
MAEQNKSAFAYSGAGFVAIGCDTAGSAGLSEDDDMHITEFLGFAYLFLAGFFWFILTLENNTACDKNEKV